MTFIPLEQVEWKTVRYLERPDETFEYQLILPRPLADWDVFGCWERERVHSMRDHLKPGMTLFDVGTEQGWCNLVYASFVGPENMVLIEPTVEFWPNIKATWERNFTVPPKAFYCGLFSDQDGDVIRDGFEYWPTPSAGPLIDRNKYQYIHEHSDNIPQMRLDDFVARSGVVPQAVTMDVEGAELLVLQGATETLVSHHPLLWISIHPDLGERDYGVVPADVHDFLGELGYQSEHIADDHESHWRFW